MVKTLRIWIARLLTVANVLVVALMLAAGFSDRLYPVDHPLFSTLGMAFPLFLFVNLGFLLFWLFFMWSRALIPIVGFVLTYTPIHIYMPINSPATVPDGAIKLVSYNVCGYSNNGTQSVPEGVAAVTAYLRDQQPDIVCLQEDNGTAAQNLDQEFAKFFPHNDTLTLSHKKLAFNCVGIHTRYPIIKKERISYETSINNGTAAWWLRVGNDTLIVVNGHFESCHLNKEDRLQYQQMLKGEMDRDSMRTESKMLLIKLAEANAKRAVQIDCVGRYVREHARWPIIVCGDFNDNPISYSRHAMSQLLTDCYEQTGRGIGLSYNRKGFFFRIDHIFCSADIQPYNCLVDDKMAASDHYPLVCWLKIGGKP